MNIKKKTACPRGVSSVDYLPGRRVETAGLRGRAHLRTQDAADAGVALGRQAIEGDRALDPGRVEMERALAALARGEDAEAGVLAAALVVEDDEVPLPVVLADRDDPRRVVAVGVAADGRAEIVLTDRLRDGQGRLVAQGALLLHGFLLLTARGY